jgi:glycosidase
MERSPGGAGRAGTVAALRRRLATLAWIALAASAAAATPPVDTSPVPFADSGSTLPEGWANGAFMEIFVRGFQDSDGDGIGDLRGLISRLDDLRDLGIKGLWLMPVTGSQDGDHGYTVTDYRNIDPAYGTLADFDELLRQAHARGIGVIVDYVINHSGTQHPIFIESASAKAGPFRDWYLWREQPEAGWVNRYDPKWQPWHQTSTGYFFGGFWRDMPDWNLRNPKVVAWHHDNLRFWLNRGVDGVRFDAVGNLFETDGTHWLNQPENFPFMADVHKLVQAYRNRFMVCEGPSFDHLGFAAVCGSTFAFEHNQRIVAAAGGDVAAVKAVADYFLNAPASMSTLLSNHDEFSGRRMADQFGGDTPAYRLAAATYLLMPGTPFIYYGEEIGMAGGAGLSGDPELRSPLSWTADPVGAGFTTGKPFRALATNVKTANVAAQKADPASLRNFYRALLALRNANPSIARGSYERPQAEGAALVFQRRFGDDRTVVAINYGKQASTLAVGDLPAGAALAALYPPPAAGAPALAVAADGKARIDLAPQSLRVWKVSR